MVKRLIQALAVVLLAAQCGCGAGKTQDIMAKIDKAKTGEEVRSALGKPDKFEAVDIPVIGKVETLVYKGADGDVTVILHNNKVFSKATGSSSNK